MKIFNYKINISVKRLYIDKKDNNSNLYLL